MKILVAGGGAFGKEHLRTLAAMDGIEIAVAEPRADELERIAATFPLAMRGQDPAMLIERFVPDGIIIATPAIAHAPLALTALSRNIPVLVEKPVAPSSDIMRQLVGAASQSRGFLQPGHILRFSAPHRQLHAIVHEGHIGDLLRIVSRRYRDSSHADRYRDVDPVFTTMVHDIDLALWFDGSDAGEVIARRLPPGGYRSLTTADVTSLAGVSWQLSLAWLHPSLDCPPDRIELVGTKGSVEFEAGRGIDLYAADGHRRLPPEGDDDPLHAELRTFIQGIQSGRNVAPVTPDDALRGLLIAERIVRAVAS